MKGVLHPYNGTSKGQEREENTEDKYAVDNGKKPPEILLKSLAPGCNFPGNAGESGRKQQHQDGNSRGERNKCHQPAGLSHVENGSGNDGVKVVFFTHPNCGEQGNQGEINDPEYSRNQLQSLSRMGIEKWAGYYFLVQ